MGKIINTAKIYKPAVGSGGGGGASPAGVDGNVQFNNAGAFGASNNLHWDKINNRLSVGMGLSPNARVDVRSPGNLSSDTAIRVRNNANTADLMRVQGNGHVHLQGFGGDVVVGHNNTAPLFGAVVYGSNIVAGFYDFAFGTYINSSSSSVNVGFLINSNLNSQINVGNRISNSTANSALIGYYLNYSNSLKNQYSIGFGIYASPTTPRLNFRGHTYNHLLLGYAPEDVNYSNSSGTNWIGIANGIPPGGQTDAFQIYSNDINPGNAAPHFRTEAGHVIRLYREDTTVGTVTFVANTGTAVNNNSTFGGYTIGQIVTALKNFGLLT